MGYNRINERPYSTAGMSEDVIDATDLFLAEYKNPEDKEKGPDSKLVARILREEGMDFSDIGRASVSAKRAFEDSQRDLI